MVHASSACLATLSSSQILSDSHVRPLLPSNCFTFCTKNGLFGVNPRSLHRFPISNPNFRTATCHSNTKYVHFNYISPLSLSTVSLKRSFFGNSSKTLLSRFKFTKLFRHFGDRPNKYSVVAMAGKSDSSETKKGLFGIPYTAHFLCLAVPIVFATTFFNGTRFGYHPTFLSTGYMFFMAESILFSIQAKGKQRDLFLKIHAFLQSISTISILVGMWAIYTNKNINGKPHFTTIHAKLGLVSMVMGLFTILGGIPALYGLPKALKKYSARVNKSHKMLGGSSFIGAVVTILLGLQVTNPGHPLHKGIVTYAMGALTLLIAIMVLKNSFLAKQAKGAIGGISPKPHTATPALSKKDE